MAGGLFAIRLKSSSHLILAFSAGAVLGVFFFDLLPESFSLGIKQYSIEVIVLSIAAGFTVYFILDRLALLHTHNHPGEHGQRGNLGAGSLSAHSFLDGLAIGTAFQFSSALGIIIAVAVIAHDFSDGVNTVTVVLKDKGKDLKALRWLMVDSLTPIAGGASTLFFHIPQPLFGLILGIFSGFFLYIGASDLLPESQRHVQSYKSILLALLGMILIYGAVKLT
jgi:ZIP family zinc transporter